ncbi:MAG: hypothetical protein WCO60_10505 [Verrucomicrobiota bacterium]
MKALLLIAVLLSSFLLSGCVNNSEPVTIHGTIETQFQSANTSRIVPTRP